MPVVSAQWDIKSLFERYASIEFANKGRPTRVRGVLEYHSNCPKCPGSKDSFILQPEIGRFSHAIRSGGCNWHGDALDFLTSDIVGMSHQEARNMLDIQDKEFTDSKPSPELLSGKEQPPNSTWQEQGKNLVARAQKYLFSPAGKDALDYLHARGLGDEIIKKKKLGYIPLQSNGRFYESSLEQWGLDPAQETKDAVRIAPGILIPWFDGGNLWRLALKRIDMDEYRQVLGSGQGLFNVGEIQYDFPAMIVEGEICAMSVEQECGDLIACVATGSTASGRLNKWAAGLNLASCVLQSFDEDKSGDVGSEYWCGKWVDEKFHPGVLRKVQRWSPWVAKDPNDILRKKFFPNASTCTLREWVEAGISITKIEPIQTHPPPIPLARREVKRKDFPIDLSKTKWHGPEVDLNALTMKEYERSYLAPDMCLNKDCPCQEIWGRLILARSLKKK